MRNKLFGGAFVIAGMVYLPLVAASAFAAASVDPKIVGVWETQVQGGRWVWTINPDGTYEFHSDAQDGAAVHSGSLSASHGHWSLRTSDGGQTDGGLYRSGATGSLIATGKSGTFVWKHPLTEAARGDDPLGTMLSNIAPGYAASMDSAPRIFECPCDSSTVN
jgi:hypothetical protein